MNKKQFQAELAKLLCGYSVESLLLGKWFASALKQLDALAKQRKHISHPRHRGGAREADIRHVMGRFFPPGLALVKGFAMNSDMSVSREQDILVCDAHTSSQLMDAGECSYVPIESCLASIEVKSDLTTTELHRSIVSCITLKKLLFPNSHPPEHQRDSDADLCYAVFAYGSTLTLDALAAKLDNLLGDVPPHYRPNLIYVLGKGLLIPAAEKALEFSHRTIFSGGPFVALAGVGTSFVKQSESYAFLWFVASILDHCAEERSKRKPPVMMEYVGRPLSMQASFERHLKKNRPEEYDRILKNVGGPPTSRGEK